MPKRQRVDTNLQFGRKDISITRGYRRSQLSTHDELDTLFGWAGTTYNYARKINAMCTNAHFESGVVWRIGQNSTNDSSKILPATKATYMKL